MKYTIAFDVADDRVRYRVVKTLLEYGYRVQKSVFEGYLSQCDVTECIAKLDAIIDKDTDSVRVYPLCKKCEEQVTILGTGKKIEQLEYIIV